MNQIIDRKNIKAKEKLKDCMKSRKGDGRFWICCFGVLCVCVSVCFVCFLGDFGFNDFSCRSQIYLSSAKALANYQCEII